jgi:hypothetical protein
MPAIKASASPVRVPRRTRAMIAVVGALAAIAAVAIFWATRRDDRVATAIPDAGTPVEKTTRLTIDPDPEGATGTIALIGDNAPPTSIPRLSHAAPFTADVRPNERYRVRLELAGYLAIEDMLTVSPGENMRFRPSFTRAPAKLDITSEPAGAQITLGGRVLGETPKLVDNLAPGTGLIVQLAKPGFQTIEKSIELRPGETTVVRETLVASERFGFLTVTVRGAATFGDVYVNGRALGVNQTLADGVRRLKVAAGPATLIVRNKAANKSHTQRITIVENQVLAIVVTL